MLAAFVLTALAAAGPQAPTSTRASVMDSAGRDPIALTLSGGVSLGAYEAGLTWSLVQFLRIPETDDRPSGNLVAVTGASAGGLNTVLAAALWCEAPDEPGDAEVEHNLLHDTWSGVGLDELLPGDPQAYSPGDGLLSSAPLEKALVHIRKALFEPGHRRYRPGCSIPFGLTVTRTEPEERDVSGLRSRSQRFVLPLRFQVDAQGEPHLLREELPRMRESSDSALELAESLDANGNAALSPLMLSNALLASGAFPLAFRARPLCDCALTCPVGQRVSTGTCSGPARGTPVTKLTCARVPPEGQRTLCQRSYVDGGIFDNAPVGLAIDLVESQLNPVPLHPINYLVVDPDFRRHAAAEVEGSMGADPAEPGLWGPMSLFGHLVATARATELSRAIRADGWNRTTQRTLAHAALLFGNFAHLHDAMVSAAGGDPLPPDEPSEMLLASERARLGHLLLDCVRSVRGDLFRDPAMLSACADSLRAAGRSSRSHADGAAGHPLTVPEVIELAHWLSVLSAPGRGESVQSGVPRYFTGSLAHRLEDLRGVRDGSAIASVTVRYLDGELDNVAHAHLPDAALQAFRIDLLNAVRSGDGLSRATGLMLRTLAAAVVIEESGGAASALEAKLLDASTEQTLDGPLLRPLLEAQGPVSPRIASLLSLSARARQLGQGAQDLARTAQQLSSSETAERRLVLSRRFPPLASSQLFNFSGFLDRELREADFYSGVYDTAHAVSDFLCRSHLSTTAGRPTPRFSTVEPTELDDTSPDTQRCLGFTLENVLAALRVNRSPRASFVVARLSRLELVAAVGPDEAQALLDAPEWRWLAAIPDTLPGDAVSATLETLASKPGPCAAGTSTHCLVDPTFDELLTGLATRGYVADSPSFASALTDRAAWLSSLTGKVADRSSAIELENARRKRSQPTGGLLLGLGASEMWSRRAISLRTSPRFEIDPSSVPNEPLPQATRSGIVLAHLLPYRVSLDVARGGLALSWFEPAVRITPWLALESQLDVLDFDAKNSAMSSTFGLLPTFTTGGLALSAGLRSSFLWDTAAFTRIGVVGRLALLQERLAFTAGVRSLAGPDKEFFVTLSIADLNGIAYWLTPWTREP